MPRPRNDKLTKDLFYFWRHDPGRGPLKEQDWKLKFEAHITNIHHSSSPSWTSNFDMGRADPKVFYQSVNETVSVNFLVVALNEQEHKDNQVQLAKLGILTRPIYKAGQGYNGVHVFYSIGSVGKGYGVITSLDYDWNSDSPWKLDRPIYTDVSLTIMKLADGDGKRPSVQSKYFI
jgi:hypothetical protein